MAKWDGRIPFDENGKPMVYVDKWTKGHEWRDNEPFEDTLTFVRFTRGRSAARAVFRSGKHKWNVEMFLTDLSDVLPQLDKGKLKGTFQFCKRGMNFGIKLVEF